MPETWDAEAFVKPYVHDTAEGRALHFSISEIQSRMKAQQPDALDLSYTQTMMAVLRLKPQPKTLAMIGLGGGSLAKFCYRHLPDTRIKVVEINPHVIALREQFLVPADDARFTVRRGDGADYVRMPPYPVDVLMVDGFDSEGQPPALCSQSFYDDCHDTLLPEGVLVVNLQARHPDSALHLGRLRRSFSDEVLVVNDREGGNRIVFALKGSLHQTVRSLPSRRPPGLSSEAWGELKPAFAQFERALAAQSSDTE